MTEALERIQIILKEAKTFALLSNSQSEDYKLLAKEALKHILSEKQLSILSFTEHLDFQKKWKAILSFPQNNKFSQQTSIRIPKNQYKIKELSCEEDENFLSLIITSENGELNKNEIIFEPILPKADAAFCFFEPSENLFKEFENKLILPSKEKIIFFTSNEKTFAEKIFQVIKTIAPEKFHLPYVATLLFASLIIETSNFIRPVSQEVLRFGSELLSSGANKETIKSVLDEEKTINFSRLLGRALARTHIDEIRNASWTFISQKDPLKERKIPTLRPSFYITLLKNFAN